MRYGEYLHGQMTLGRIATMAMLSIIVPIYKTEKYLAQCLDSIQAQTFKDFEAILIDDGSPDHCGTIAENYAALDSRFIVIHQDNKGVSAARNAGLEKAQGKYCGFVDPDDWIESDMYVRMVEVAEQEEATIVCCNYKEVDANGLNEHEHPVPKIKSPMNSEEFIDHLFDSPRTIAGSVWNKLFRNDIRKPLFDENISIGEDRLFMVEYCDRIPVKGIYIRNPLYVVRIHSESTVKKNNEKLIEGLDAEKKIINITRGISKDLYQHSIKDFFDTCERYMQLYKKEGKSIALRKCKECYQLNIEHYIKDIILNRYFSPGLKYTYLKMYRDIARSNKSCSV